MLKKLYSRVAQYKTAAIYSLSSILKALATLLVGFVIAKYISPQELGLWTGINLILTYSIFLQAGVINGLNLLLPEAYGKDNLDEAKRLAGVAQTFTLIISILGIVGALGYYCFSLDVDFKQRIGVFSIIFITIVTFYQNYLLSTFRSNDSFLRLSYIQLAETLFNLVSLVLIIWFSYYGLILKAMLVLSFFVILLHLYRPIKTRVYWDTKIFLELFKVGVPIFLLIIIDAFATSVDKLLLIKYANLDDVGIYAFGLYSLTTFTLFSASVASYVYPKMTFNFAQNSDKTLLWKYVKKITVLLLGFQIPVAIMLYFLIPHLLEFFFPQYSKSREVMQILLWAGVFKGSIVGVNVLWSMKKWKLMYIYQVVYAILIVGSVFVFLNIFEDKLKGVAFGMLIANFLNFFSGIYLSFRGTHA